MTIDNFKREMIRPTVLAKWKRAAAVCKRTLEITVMPLERVWEAEKVGG